jgi:hypothetical protein
MMAKKEIRRQARKVEPLPNFAKLGAYSFSEDAIYSLPIRGLLCDVCECIDCFLRVLRRAKCLGVAEILIANRVSRGPVETVAGDLDAVVLA